MDIRPKKASGTLNISDAVLAQIASSVVKDLDGVERISGKSDAGIRVKTEDGVAVIDLDVVLNTAHPLQQTAEQIQKTVKSMVQDMTGIAVSCINVQIVDIVNQD